MCSVTLWLKPNPKPAIAGERHPQLCTHLEMETYTWEVLPPALKTQNVVDQLAAEYAWTLAQLNARGLA